VLDSFPETASPAGVGFSHQVTLRYTCRVMAIATGTDLAEAFADALAGRLGSNLVRVSLFGSRARGEHRRRSDYDLMIVLRRASAEARSTIHRLAAEWELERSIDLSTKVTDADTFEHLKASGLAFWSNFRRDERILWPATNLKSE
jgi:predicted nucleotidyltransferase